jgi:PPM family protein phosphatase
MEMFRRLFGQSSDEPDDPNTVTQPIPDTQAEESAAHQDESMPAALASDAGNATTAPLIDDSAPTLPVPPGTGAPPQAVDGATRKLPLEAVIASRNAHLNFGQSTDVGMVRNNNQDAMLTFYYASQSIDERPDFGLFVVADGMGGHHDGEKASAIVTRKVAHHVLTNIFIPMMSNTDNNIDRPPLTESLIEAIQTANRDVLTEVPDGGTTVTAVAIVGDLAYFAHVGDSRAYLISQEGIEQITRDHSLVQRLIELDQLTPEEAIDHPQQNVLYRAIGQSDSLEVDALTRRMPPNSYLLLCSDGLWGAVDDDAIYSIVQQNPDPQNACDRLVATANDMGGRDNITAIILHIPS